MALLCLSAVAKEPVRTFDRGLGDPSNTFIPKGMMSVGASVSYHTYDVGKNDGGYEMLSLLQDVKGNLSTLSLSPSIFYFVANNTAVGLQFGYTYSDMGIDSASLSMDEDTKLDLSNHYYVSQGYTGNIAMRKYIPLFGSKVFAMFTELRVGGTQKYAKSYSLNEGEKDGTFSDSYSVNFGLYPGLTAFLTNDFAFEVSLSMLECKYTYTKQIHNQVKESCYSDFGASFKPNLLGISFSVMYYIPIKYR